MMCSLFISIFLSFHSWQTDSLTSGINYDLDSHNWEIVRVLKFNFLLFWLSVSQEQLIASFVSVNSGMNINYWFYLKFISQSTKRPIGISGRRNEETKKRKTKKRRKKACERLGVPQGVTRCKLSIFYTFPPYVEF